MKTFFVFLDIPVHVEYHAGDVPLMLEKTVIGFRASLRNPRNLKQVRKIDGDYEVFRRRLLYSTEGQNAGLVQYLELKPIN